MALTVTHPFVSAVVDENNPGEVGPDEWNAAHSLSGTLDAAQMPALTGDVTTPGASLATTLATVNANVGTFGSATQVAQVTYNAKGLATAVANVTVTPAASSVTGGAALTRTDDTNVTLTLGGSPTTALLAATSITVGWTGTLAASRGGTGISSLGTGVATALGVNVGSAGAFVIFNGALGTPSSGTLTSCTGLPVSTGIAGLGTGIATALAVNTGSAGAPVLFNGAGGTPSSLTLTNATGLPLSTGVTGDLPFANLTQGSGLSVLGVTGSSTADFASITAGSDHQVLRRNGAGLSFGTIDLSQSNTVGSSILAVANGGTNAATAGAARTNLGLGTAAVKDTGASGNTIPLLDANNTWTGQQTFTVSDVVIRKSGAASGLTSVRDDDHGDGAGAGVTIWGQNHYGQDSASADQIYTSMSVVVFDDAAGSADATWLFNAAAAGSVLERMRVGAGVYHSTATGGDKGDATINFKAVYDDNVLLTCYPFDQYIDGKVDFDKWDAKVPNVDATVFATQKDGSIKGEKRFQERRHEWARKFAERIGTEHDPLTLDGYAKHWMEKRHLSALPNEANYDPVGGKLDIGSWVQRLIETVETQAILIEQCNQRIKAIEKGKP